jgi:hypothetical protein
MLSLCLIVGRRRWEPVVLAMFICGVILGLRRLHYAEFSVAQRMLINGVNGGFRRELVAQLALGDFRESLTEACNPGEVWRVLQEYSPEFGFRPVRMQLAGQTFGNVGDEGTLSWEARIEIVSNTWVDLARDQDVVLDTAAALPFADKLREILLIKSTTMSEDVLVLSDGRVHQVTVERMGSIIGSRIRDVELQRVRLEGEQVIE